MRLESLTLKARVARDPVDPASVRVSVKAYWDVAEPLGPDGDHYLTAARVAKSGPLDAMAPAALLERTAGDLFDLASDRLVTMGLPPSTVGLAKRLFYPLDYKAPRRAPSWRAVDRLTGAPVLEGYLAFDADDAWSRMRLDIGGQPETAQEAGLKVEPDPSEPSAED